MERCFRTVVILLITLCFDLELYAQDILLTRSREKTTHGIPATEYYFDVTVKSIPTRKVQVQGFLQTNSKGTVILSSGGKGQNYYSSNFDEPSRDLVRSLHIAGFEIFEIKYTDSTGWAQHCEGIGGFKEAVEIYTDMVFHLHQNYFQNKEITIATGNSGGSFQIGFGLTNYGLDSIMDMVILTGGPPVSDLKNGIFGDISLEQRWPDRLGGMALTDFLMGWTIEMYCVNRTAPDSIISLVEAASLAAHESTREYSYKTLVNFVQSDDPTNSHHQARIYYDSIKSEKAWYYLPNVDVHAVPKSEEGADKIEELILEYVRTTSKVTALPNNTFVNVFPNPTSDILSININGSTGTHFVSLADLNGSTVLETSFIGTQIAIPINQLRGIYNLKVRSESTQKMQLIKVVVK